MKQNNWTASCTQKWSRKLAGDFYLTGKCDWKRDRKCSTWRMRRRFAAVFVLPSLPWSQFKFRFRFRLRFRIPDSGFSIRLRTSLSKAKATSSAQRPQSCTEAATKYYKYIVNETDEEREHWLPTLPKATRLDQAKLKVYSENYLLRCSDRQQELCTSRISFQRTRDSRSAFTPWATMGFYSKLYFTTSSLEQR